MSLAARNEIEVTEMAHKIVFDHLKKKQKTTRRGLIKHENYSQDEKNPTAQMKKDQVGIVLNKK